MSFCPLSDSPQQSFVATLPKSRPDAVGMAGAGNEAAIDQLLTSARHWAHTTAWGVYRAGEHMHLVGQGDPQAKWPSSVASEEFEAFCQARHLHRWPTGRGESVLGWLLAPIKDDA